MQTMSFRLQRQQQVQVRLLLLLLLQTRAGGASAASSAIRRHHHHPSWSTCRGGIHQATNRRWCISLATTTTSTTTCSGSSPPQSIRSCCSLTTTTTASSQSSSDGSKITKDYPHYEIRQTRWNDMDGFGHINNTIYYQYMDDAINMHLINRGIGRNYPRFIAENGIQFIRPISFPTNVHVGLQVSKLGTSSVTYKIGFFFYPDDESSSSSKSLLLAAKGKFVHVYVDEGTGRPVTIPAEARKVLQELLVVEV